MISRINRPVQAAMTYGEVIAAKPWGKQLVLPCGHAMFLYSCMVPQEELYRELPAVGICHDCGMATTFCTGLKVRELHPSDVQG